MTMTTTKPRLLISLCSLLLASSVVVHGRYFGGPDSVQQQQLLQDQDLFDIDGSLPNGNGNVPISALEGSLDQPAIVDDEMPDGLSFSVKNALLVSSRAQENIEWAKLSAGSLAKYGQVAGVAASADCLFAFHRGGVQWNDSSFNPETNVYNYQNKPIAANTVVALDPVTGEEMFAWGNNSFYMPHGISVDPQGNIWLTDVALHQAFRFKKNNFDVADLVLGERFVPGSDDKHFCKPTDVAISSTGVVYVSDGYCNSRVAIFSARGAYLTEIGHNDKMLIPHSMSLLEIEDLLCVADRENGRILCYNAGLANYRDVGKLLFEVTPSQNPAQKLYAIGHIGDVILALNGGADQTKGLSVDLATEQIVDTWAPANGSAFHQAHDLTVAHDGRSFYVCQFDAGQKVVKFDMIETTPMFMN
ncbi:hypothetical protein TYRP_022036 [Tyrophagus putrescentiae]|nr:hypothetical protein TYRP_022036 [Tyrophagus putrescentiae]